MFALSIKIIGQCPPTLREELTDDSGVCFCKWESVSIGKLKSQFWLNLLRINKAQLLEAKTNQQTMNSDLVFNTQQAEVYMKPKFRVRA